jgi:predicted phage baseplate assembly protein
LDLDDDFATWSARRDLLESSRYSRDFVVEWAIDGRPALRFGDGINGLPPSPGAVVAVNGRFGFGPAGNIGTGALAHVVLPPAQEGAQINVTNPLPGRGGAAPEPVASIRIAAPQAFRRPERAVTAADYAEAAMRMDEVSNAVAVPRWTGAWQTILVYVDRRGGSPVDHDFKRAVARHLEHFRLMGFDATVREAKSAPLEIELLVCAKPGEFRSTIAARVRNALRPAGSETGVRGFFHADNFTFGAPLYLSKLIAAVMGVEGVQSVTAKKFQRLDRLAASELDNGVIKPDEFEVLRLDDDPSFPERGKLVLSMAGGR